MTAHRLCITLRPFIYDLISAKAKQRGVSISRQIEDCAEGFLVKDESDYEPDCVITREELDRRSKKLDDDISSRKAKVFSDSKSLIQYLHEEAAKLNR